MLLSAVARAATAETSQPPPRALLPLLVQMTQISLAYLVLVSIIT